jgi:glycine/D-amino acid oxidase-like deaminating enzyme
MDFLIAGKGMFGAAIARHLAPHAGVAVVGPEAATDGSGPYGAHYDEGRIIRESHRDPLWAELARRARAGMAQLDPALITPCGALITAPQDGPDCCGATAETSTRPGPDIRVLTPGQASAEFPMLRFRPGEAILHQPGAGHFSPRRYVALATAAARAHGAEIVPGAVRALRSSAAGIEAELDDGRRLRANAVIIATGGFAAGSGLLPASVALRTKSEVYLMAELDHRQAAGLRAMPCAIRTIIHPQLADLYALPPIRYPDGRIYLKLGVNTMADRWLPDPAAVHAWYRHGDSAGPLPALREVLADLLPGIRVRSWQSRRCADAYTAHRRPYIDVLEPGRVIVALGGNGRGAQAADAIGHVTAQLAMTGEWASDLPRDAFRCVPAGTWNGMRLLRDQAI